MGGGAAGTQVVEEREVAGRHEGGGILPNFGLRISTPGVKATLLWWPGGVGVDGCVPNKPGKRPPKCFVWHQWLTLPLFSKVFSSLPGLLGLLGYFNKDNDKTGGGAGNRSAPRFGVDQGCSRPHNSHRRRCRARRGGRLPDTLLGFTRHRPDPGMKIVGMSSTGSSGERATHIFTVV